MLISVSERQEWMGMGSSLVIPELKHPQDTIGFQQWDKGCTLFQHGEVAEGREEQAAQGHATRVVYKLAVKGDKQNKPQAG